MPTASSCRLSALVARDTRVAVVFRRGPSKQVRMLRWNLATDEITGGQWLMGRIYEERCGLSPDGQLVVYFAGKFKGPLGTFTAVSRPPFFTALVLWPEGSTWGGGGFFENNRRLVLNYNCALKELHEGATLPKDFVVSHLGEYRQRHVTPTSAEAQGWTQFTGGAGHASKPNPVRAEMTLERSSAYGRVGEVNGPFIVFNFQVRDARRGTHENLGRLDWADWDLDGALLFAREGCLYRRDASDACPSKLVADLRDQVFTTVRPPPDAQTWPTPVQTKR